MDEIPVTNPKAAYNWHPMFPKIHLPKNEEVAENGICRATTIKLATKKLISNSPEGSMRYLDRVLCTQSNPKHTEHPSKTEIFGNYNHFLVN